MTPLPQLYLIRHSSTEWAESHRHTGRTDIPLNARGEQRAALLKRRLAEVKFSRVYCSPLQRAKRTCELCGLADRATLDPNLLEWNYGQYEGLTSDQILATRPGWELFRDGCPGGESPADAAARADQFIATVRAGTGTIAAFSSGHIIRMLAARWLEMEPSAGRIFFCSTASVNILGYEHDNAAEPVVKLWNDDRAQDP